ncbi:MAG: hypothetical protein LBT38_11805 [Deltaproteobacteria bacterium]|jgi:hypothetical protein|nr:hypothetical protein [Deltaproteobacteria bacterium]
MFRTKKINQIKIPLSFSSLERVCGAFGLFLLISLLSVQALALPDLEVQAMAKENSLFRQAENRILAVWKDLPSDFKSKIRPEQIEWINNGRDQAASSLIAKGLSKAEAYTKVTNDRSDYLLSRLKNNSNNTITTKLNTNSNSNCVSGNCKNGIGVWENDEYTYAGEYKNGKKHGKGVERRKKGNQYLVYNGNFVNDTFSGSGILYINNGRENPYIFGEFRNGELADGSRALIKFENGIEAYYSISSNNGKSTMTLIKKDTAELYCSKNKTSFHCIQRWAESNKDALATLLVVGYISAVVNSKNRISFNDIVKGMQSIEDSLKRRSQERGEEFANRILRKLRLR